MNKTAYKDSLSSSQPPLDDKVFKTAFQKAKK